MTDPKGELDDPALQQAVRRAMGGETAPPELRARIVSLLSASAPAPAPARSSGRRVLNAKVLALAACVIVAVGVMVMQIRSTFFPPSAPAPTVMVSAFNPRLADLLVRAADTCDQAPTKHPANVDFAALHTTLTKESGVNSFAAPIGAGWHLASSGICKIGDANAAFVSFVSADKTVDVFSLPAPDACASGTSYQQEVNHHAVAGFASGSAMYCVVGVQSHGDMPIKTALAVLDRVRAGISASAIDSCIINKIQTASARP